MSALTSAWAIKRQASPPSRAVSSAARVGLVAQAIIYVTLAWLAADIADGRRGPQANQQGALAEIVSRPGGVALVVVLVVGFACYCLWRLSEAIFGIRSTIGRSIGCSRWLERWRMARYAYQRSCF